MAKFSDWGPDVQRKVFEVGFGCVVVIVLSIFNGKAEIHAFVDDVAIGLLTIIATAFILEPIDQKRTVREMQHTILNLQSELREVKRGITSVNSDFADHIDRYTLALRFTNKSLDRDEMPNAWERMLWSMRGNFDATSFVRPSDYHRSYPDLGIAIQEAKVRVAKSRIRRIFIVENEQELEAIGAHVHKQSAAGVEVSYILYEDLRQEVNLDRYDTLDFGLFDDSRSVFLWLLHDRVVSGGKIELQTDQYEKYRNLFDTLCRRSRTYQVPRNP